MSAGNPARDSCALIKKLVFLNEGPRSYWAHFHVAAALAQLGRSDEARAAVAAGLALNPTFTIRRYRKAVRSEDAVVRAQGYRLVEAMRQAGVPEGRASTIAIKSLTLRAAP
jgi:hypothetical protein